MSRLIRSHEQKPEAILNVHFLRAFLSLPHSPNVTVIIKPLRALLGKCHFTYWPTEENVRLYPAILRPRKAVTWVVAMTALETSPLYLLFSLQLLRLLPTCLQKLPVKVITTNILLKNDFAVGEYTDVLWRGKLNSFREMWRGCIHTTSPGLQ